MTRMGPLSIVAAMVVGCGGVTRVDPAVDGGGYGSDPSTTGGAGGTGGAGTGGAETGGKGIGGAPHPAGGAGGRATPMPGGAGGALPVVPDCDSAVPAGTPCAAPSARCGGPCSNSWRVEVVCKDGTWAYDRVAVCGPNAGHAPQCKNSFNGGELTPCCPEGSLDCTGKPNGYPGFGCTPGDGSFCSCTCFEGMSQCGC